MSSVKIPNFHRLVSITMQDLRKEFPVLTSYTYLNTASCGLLSKSLTKWRQEHDLLMLAGGSTYRDTHKEHLESVRNTVARFFDVNRGELALVPNFSYGMNTLLEGLSNGLKVLLIKDDYPSINWGVEFRDFDTCYASLDGILEDNIAEAIEKYRPDVFAFSIVQYLSGIKIDFDFLKEVKTKYPDLLLIGDGTQFLGTSSFSFEESPLDVLGASCYKWMLSGYGNGIFMIKEELHKKISPSTIGFNSSDSMDPTIMNVPLMKRFEPGHQDALNYGSIERSIQHFERVGMKQIETNLKTLNLHAKECFSEYNLLDTNVLKRKDHSCIYTIRGDEERFQKLKENNIICSLRGNGIRVSFHYYNSLDDLNHLMSVIRKMN